MERIIEIEVTGCHLTKSGNLAGVEGESDATTLEITFDESWDGFSKTIVWIDAKGENATDRILSFEELKNPEDSPRVFLATVPGKVMTVPGDIIFSVIGYQNGIRQKSVCATLSVRANELEPSKKDISATDDVSAPTLAELLQSQISSILNDVSDMYTKAPPKIINGTWHIWDSKVKDYVDTGLTAKGDKGDQGEKGDDGYSPQRGTDYWTEEDKEEIRNDLGEIVADKEDAANKSTTIDDNADDVKYPSSKAVKNFVEQLLDSYYKKMDKQNIFGCVWNKEKRCNFDTNAKTVNIPQYSRIVYSDTVITDTGTSAWGGVTVDLSDVQHGFIVFNKSTKSYAAQIYTDTTFSADEIVLFAYGDYGADYLAGLSDVTVNGVTRILDYSVTTDKVADGAITTKKLAPYAVDSTISTVAGRNALFFNATKYCNFDTVNKKLTIPSYSRVMCGRTVYVGGVLNETVTLDLSGAQNGYITYNNADNKWTVYTYSTVRVDSENELIMFVYSNYGKIVSSPSAYTVDGKLFGVDTDLVIPDGYIEQNMLAPKLMQNQLSRCPKYTYTDLSEIGFSAWSDISIIGDKLWLFYPSKDENHTQMDGRIEIVNKETLEVVKTITHNFGHMNTCDYCKETNCLIVGNLPGNTTYPAALYVFYNVSDWENVDTLDFTTVDKTIVDMRSAFLDATTAACSWGETNFAYNNVVYVSLGFNKKFAKIILGMGTNQLTYGTYISTTNNKFNGTYNVLVDSDFVPMASMDEVTQGATFYNGQMLTANGDDRTARASLWQFDINGNIQRELMEFPIYNADGQKNSQYKTYTEGITYDEETGYIYQGIFSGQVHAYRFYLIKYKL